MRRDSLLTPLRLQVAAALGYPDGSMTAVGYAETITKPSCQFLAALWTISHSCVVIALK